LAASYDAPTSDADCRPDVWGDELPHQCEPLKEDVGDVEDGEEPLIFWGGDIELRIQAGNFGVSADGSIGNHNAGEDTRCSPDV
jgi:hypothetical protein